MAALSGEEVRRGEAVRRTETEAISEGVDARSWIFFEERVVRGVGANGGFNRPILGIRSFWEAGGMERVVAISAERSRMVDDAGRRKM